MKQKLPRKLYGKRYSGELGCPPKPDDPELTPAREAQLLDLLKVEHGIAADDPQWERSLVMALARSHVEAFQEPRSRGAPRKSTDITTMLLSAQYGWREENRLAFERSLLTEVISECNRQALKGRGAITKALKQIVNNIPRTVRRPPKWAIDKKLERYQRLISVARRHFPDLGNKLRAITGD